MITLKIPREIISGNILAYGHWRNRTKDRNDWESRIRVALALLREEQRHKEACAAEANYGFGSGATNPLLTTEPCQTHRTVRVYSMRHGILDDDNLSAGSKHLRDSLTRLGLIRDDNKKWATFHYTQERIPRSESCYTIVTIEETK